MPTGQARPDGRQVPLLAGAMDIPTADADERRVMAGSGYPDSSVRERCASCGMRTELLALDAVGVV